MKHIMTFAWNLFAPKIRHNWRSCYCFMSSRRMASELRTKMKEWTYFTVFRARIILLVCSYSRPSLSPSPGVSITRTFCLNMHSLFISTRTPLTSVVSDFGSAEVLNRSFYPHNVLARLLFPTPVAPKMQITFVLPGCSTSDSFRM